jgi:DNA adenine methylase
MPSRRKTLKKRNNRTDFSVAARDFGSETIVPVRPPFGYYGAKQRLARRIVSSLPPHNAWVEAFCGSAAITLAKPPAPIEVINDLDNDIVNLFRQLREKPDELYRVVTLTPYSRVEFEKAKERRGERDPLERARLFLISAMMTVNGTVGNKRCGFSFSQSYERAGREARVNRWYNLPERLSHVVQRLRHVRIENRDARELLQMFADRPATLVYLDPPYFPKCSHKYSIGTNNEAFHSELLEICCKARCMILISGYDNKLYKSILTRNNGWTRTEIKTKTKDTKGKDYPRTEVLWCNTRFRKAKKAGRVLIRLSTKERARKKINPPRKR